LLNMVYELPRSKSGMEKLRSFLHRIGLNWDDGIEYTVSLMDAGEVVATGSRQGNVLKCVGIADDRRGEGLAASVVTELIKNAALSGHHHLFLFTTPKSKSIFLALGFYTVTQTETVVLMENRRNGAAEFVAGIKTPAAHGSIGCIVANCNPFTNGHLHLAETAAHDCDFVYFFLLSENQGLFPAEVRRKLAEQGLAHLNNVAVVPTGDYLISHVTFPDYFLKDKGMAVKAHYDLDLAVFCDCFAVPLGITKRFVGEEPFDPLTMQYNERMKQVLPKCGIELIEIPRAQHGGTAISASAVRKLLSAHALTELCGYVPETTYQYLEGLCHE
jgi:[citrate (pro-3S)-lyase] ligase